LPRLFEEKNEKDQKQRLSKAKIANFMLLHLMMRAPF
jgi:hypothetical protein